MRRSYRGLGIYAGIIIAILILYYLISQGVTSAETISYTTFEEALEEDLIASVEIKQNSDIPTGVLYLTLTDDEETTYKVVVPDVTAAQELMDSAGFTNYIYDDVPTKGWFEDILPLLIIFAVVFIFYIMMSNQNASANSGGSRMMNFGKSRAQMTSEEENKTTFADVAGLAEEKEELEEVVDFLKDPVKYTKLGARIPKGMLLVGPPGTGKTLLAKAVAGEAGVPFFTISGSDFVEMFVGVGASRVRDLFAEAKRNAPCIIFIDEIDAVARRRGTGLGGGHDEREQTLNQMLVEMDGFGVNEGIIVMAATNRVDILDPAIMRPGRFDRKVAVGRPDVAGREAILRVHAKNKPLAKEVDLKTLAKRTPGFTGADLSNLLNEAALLAARHDKSEIQMPDLEEAIDKVMAGPEKKSRIISDEEKENTAYHEVGHALLAKLLKDCDPLHKVSIIPRGMALGITLTLPEKDHLTMRKNQLLDRITMILGGRVAEELIYGKDNITTGASNDLEKVSALARSMVTTYGMSDKMGNLAYGKDQEHIFMGRNFGNTRDFSEEIAADIDKEVKKIVDAQYEYAKKLLGENRDMLEYIAKNLLEKETLDNEEVTKIFGTIIDNIKNNYEVIINKSGKKVALPKRDSLSEQRTPEVGDFTEYTEREEKRL